MKPFEPKGLPDGCFALANAGRDYLLFAPSGGAISLDLSERDETFAAAWVDPKSGKPSAAGEVRGGRFARFESAAGRPAVLWLTVK